MLRKNTREGDLAVRLGGDEFLLLFASIHPDVARRRIDAIVTAVAGAPWGDITLGLRVTISLGLAFGHSRAIERLTHNADAALYLAKAAGGNQGALSAESLMTPLRSCPIDDLRGRL